MSIFNVLSFYWGTIFKLKNISKRYLQLFSPSKGSARIVFARDSEEKGREGTNLDVQKSVVMDVGLLAKLPSIPLQFHHLINWVASDKFFNLFQQQLSHLLNEGNHSISPHRLARGFDERMRVKCLALKKGALVVR